MRSPPGIVSRKPRFSRFWHCLAPPQLICLATLFAAPCASMLVLAPDPAIAGPEPAPAARECDIAGLIWSVRSAAGVDVEPLQGRLLQAGPRLPLCPGDRFRWRDTDAEVWAQVHGVRDARFSPGSSTDQIPTRTLGFRVPADGPLYAAAINLASHAARAENRSRSRPRSQQPGAPTPRALAFLPGGEQFIDVSTRGIAAVWRGAPATARLSLDGRAIEQTDTGLGWWVRFPVDAATGAYRLELDDPGGLHWAIRRTSPVPAPPWMTDGGPRSDAQRLVRALWILRGDQQAWKLFAISEIATMADDGHFLALQLWRAVLSGEIEDLLP